MKLVIIRPLAILLMGFSYLLSRLFNSSFLENLVGIFALITVISFIPFLTKIPRILISSLLIVSLVLFIRGEGLIPMINSFDANAGLLAIFIFVPLISIPIKAGRYLEYLDTIFNHYIKSSIQLYSYLKGSIMGIGAVMNLGTIPIMYQLTNTDAFKNFDHTRLAALNRGFSLSFLWSPYFVSIALILSYFNLTWLELFPYGIMFAFIGFVLGFVMERKTSRPIEISKKADAQSVKRAKRKLLQLVAIITLMTIITMTIEHFVDLSVLTIIPIIAMIVSTIWSLVYLSPKQFGNKLWEYSQERLPKMGNELSLFIAAGVFGVAILNAGASEWIIYLLEASGITHVLILIPIAAVIIVMFSFIGIHPLITLTAMTITFSTTPIFADDHLILAYGLLNSWMVTVMSSPFSATNLMVASLTNSNSVQVGLKQNGLYSFILWVINYLILVGIYYIF